MECSEVKTQADRIRFTPDLLPGDVTGIHYFNQKTSEFEFRAGGIFTNVLQPRIQWKLPVLFRYRRATSGDEKGL